MELQDIMKAVQALGDDEKQKLKELLDAPTENSADEVPDAPEGADAEDEAKPEEPVETEQNPKEAQDPTSEAASIEDAPIPAEDAPLPTMTAAPEAAAAEEPAAAPPVEDAQPAASPPATDDQGGDMPIDYEQVIEGMNAKILALESENKQLKTKVEGAFGLAAKPGGFAAVNKLYGDISDIPPMRK